MSVGSETQAGVMNVQVYDNSFDGSEQALRIKSDWVRRGKPHASRQTCFIRRPLPCQPLYAVCSVLPFLPFLP
jgi:hypothetical protein